MSPAFRITAKDHESPDKKIKPKATQNNAKIHSNTCRNYTWLQFNIEVYSYIFGTDMVVIRLTRGGSHKRPFYHIVATESRFKRDGRFIERLGFYNPIERSSGIDLRVVSERIDYWVSKGARVSNAVTRLVKMNAKNSKDKSTEKADEKSPT